MRGRRPTSLPASRPPPPHMVCPLSTRQKAKAFNQPLSFDTSRVTTMDTMFYVHSACALRQDST